MTEQHAAGHHATDEYSVGAPVIAVAGGKGGSGKTTTALGLARALDGPVVAADADCDMPNLHALAGVDREPTLAAVGRHPPTEVAQRDPGGDGALVLPAPRSDGDADVGSALSRLRAGAARTPTGSRVRRVLVDCPAGAGPDAVRPLRVADGTLLVSTACAPALRDAAKTAAMARAVDSPPLGVVLTRASVAPPGVADLLECPVLGCVPAAGPHPLADGAVDAAYGRIADELERTGVTRPRGPARTRDRSTPHRRDHP